jgi:23S rRNA (uridine2552-2'-O)-methyltransferase
MRRRQSSQRWLDRQHRDPYVKQARQSGYRSRAAMKLLALQEREQVLRPGLCVLDLGAAPGGWSQVVAQLLRHQGHIIAVDKLPCEPIPGVAFIQGDFSEQAVIDRILTVLDGRQFDVMLSDMAPNSSGIVAVDQPRMIHLGEQMLDLAPQLLQANGHLIMKMFQGEGFDLFIKTIRNQFASVRVRKPLASRSQSREVYIVAKGFRPAHDETSPPTLNDG